MTRKGQCYGRKDERTDEKTADDADVGGFTDNFGFFNGTTYC